MELNERQQLIVNLLRENGKVNVAALSKELHYSEMTIRRDLTKMEKAGLLKRSLVQVAVFSSIAVLVVELLLNCN